MVRTLLEKVRFCNKDKKEVCHSVKTAWGIPIPYTTEYLRSKLRHYRGGKRSYILL